MGSCGTISSGSSNNCQINELRAVACRTWEIGLTVGGCLVGVLILGVAGYCVYRRRLTGGYEEIKD